MQRQRTPRTDTLTHSNLRDDVLMMASLVEFAADGILVTNTDGEILFANRASCEVFALSEAALLHSTLQAILPEPFADLCRLAQWTFDSAHRFTLERDSQGNVTIETACALITLRKQEFRLVTVRDVTQRVSEEEQLRYQSTHDALTGLYNRAFFEAEVDRLKRGRITPISVIALDVDELKALNDTHGHAAGDQHLKRLAKLLRDVFRADDVVARLGGDEFSILLPLVDADERNRAIERLRLALDTYNTKADRAIRVSIGGATARRPEALGTAMRLADERMYQEKRRNRRLSDGVIS